MYVEQTYVVFYKEHKLGCYYVYSNNGSEFYFNGDVPKELLPELHDLGIDRNKELKRPHKTLSSLIKDEFRVSGMKRIVYERDGLRLERIPKETDERFFVYRCSAEKGDPEYSEKDHSAPHYEGPKTPEGMKEWCTWYAFTKMDDGTYQAELDESWWWGGGHNDGGTIHVPIPEEWHSLPYEEFLGNVLSLAAARHYGFDVEELLAREGLKEFFGY